MEKGLFRISTTMRRRERGFDRRFLLSSRSVVTCELSDGSTKNKPRPSVELPFLIASRRRYCVGHHFVSLGWVEMGSEPRMQRDWGMLSKSRFKNRVWLGRDAQRGGILGGRGVDQ